MPLQVELVAADRRLWAGEASMVVARTVEGEIGVLPGHAPLLAVLAEGEVRVTPVSGEVVTARLTDGFVSVEHDRVTVVSDSTMMSTGSSAS